MKTLSYFLVGLGLLILFIFCLICAFAGALASLLLIVWDTYQTLVVMPLRYYRAKKLTLDFISRNRTATGEQLKAHLRSSMRCFATAELAPDSLEIFLFDLSCNGLIEINRPKEQSQVPDYYQLPQRA